MGHDSERAAMIYQHEARGADKAITYAIDKHVEDEQRQDDDGDGGPNGPQNDERPGLGNSFRPGLLHWSG
jgi:hypothetical protein